MYAQMTASNRWSFCTQAPATRPGQSAAPAPARRGSCPHLALVEVLLVGTHKPQRRQGRLRGDLDQVVVQSKPITQRTCQMRGARGQRARALAQGLARRQPTFVEQVQLGDPLGVRGDGGLAAPAVATMGDARLRGQRRISRTAGSTQASWPGHTGIWQRKHGGNVNGASMHSNVPSP